MYRAILFDLDDTLYDFYSYRIKRLQSALVKILKRYKHLDQDQLISTAIVEQVYTAQLPAFLRCNGVEDESLIADACDSHALEWFERMVLADDTLQTLQTLHSRFKLGLVTNGPVRIQWSKIERFGLSKHMDTLVISDEVGVAKPDAAIFFIALERLDVTHAEALFVGDSPEHDLRGAYAAGIPCIWMNRRGASLPTNVPPPMATIMQLGDLPPLLEKLCI